MYSGDSQWLWSVSLPGNRLLCFCEFTDLLIGKLFSSSEEVIPQEIFGIGFEILLLYFCLGDLRKRIKKMNLQVEEPLVGSTSRSL